MKAITYSILFSFCCFATQAQKSRTTAEFTGIETSGNFNVTLTQSEQPSLIIEAPDNIESLIKTEVSNGILHISFAKGKMRLDSTPKLFINVKKLESIEASGITKIKATNKFTVDKIKLEISGVGNIEMELQANEIRTEQSGAGNIKLSGTTNLLKADISGAGNLKSADLKSDSVIIDISGVGEAKVNAIKSLEADVSGAGSINYTGNPEIKKVKVSGVGSVHPSSASTSDTTEIKLSKKRILIIDHNDNNEKSEDKWENEDKDEADVTHDNFHHWTGVGFGVNGYLTSDNKTSLPSGINFLDLNYSKSLNFILNIAEKDIHLYKNYINLVTGLGFECNSYEFKNNISLDPNSNTVSASVDSLIDYKKNKLKTTSINIPLLLEFNTNNNSDKSFHFAAGMIFGYKLSSKTKQTYDWEKREIKVKVKDDFNLAPFRSALTFRAGYDNVTLFANYSLTSLFESKKGPSLYPFSIGLSFTAD